MADVLTAKRLQSVLYFDDRLRRFVWRRRPHKLSSIRPGSLAGYIRKDGKRVITIDGTPFFEEELMVLWRSLPPVKNTRNQNHVARLALDARHPATRDKTCNSFERFFPPASSLSEARQRLDGMSRAERLPND